MVFTKPQLFFTTPPAPCPYKEGEEERKLVTEFSNHEAIQQYDLLIKSGFRRSHNYLYRPLYNNPDYCLSVRVRVDDFAMKKSQRRVWNKNQKLQAKAYKAVATEEQFDLFRSYVQRRHGDGDMSDMSWDDYKDMVDTSPIDTEIIEFRTVDNSLVSACLVDWVNDGVSAVYSFFDIRQSDKGLGSYMILWLLDEARRRKLHYLYLGYWIKESQKMAYKSKFTPLEAFRAGAWTELSFSSDFGVTSE
ncbi:arginyltransferase [Kiloniella majae]|uniref:arginyltransferase n=1 Tax=Kiloniella majae TaxID=1938558 RepID=UPI000A279391|nr:arginyltransferase [Kiloniella majae]